MTADTIIVVRKGLVSESGKFKELERFKDFHAEIEENVDLEEELPEEEEVKDVDPVVLLKKEEAPQNGAKKRKASLTKEEMDELAKKKE